MTEVRIKPFRSTETTWNSIFDFNNVIPMNQRKYEWGKKELEIFLNDIKSIFEEDKYIEKMGAIIYYTGNKNKREIWDGQQRTITVILILLALADMHNFLKTTIINKLSVNELTDTLNIDQIKIKEKYGEEIENVIIPKLYCINPDDQDAIVHIINEKYKCYVKFVQNNNGNDDDDDDDDDCNNKNNNLKCNECDKTYSHENTFKTHLNKYHHNKEDNKKSNVYYAYDYIYKKLHYYKYDNEKTKQLFKFIMHDIYIQMFDSDDPIYVSKIFDWENNRGKDVGSLDIIKNLILSKLPDDKKSDCYDKWTNLKEKHKTDQIYKNYGEKIFTVSIKLLNHKLFKSEYTNNENLNDLFEIFIKKSNNSTFDNLTQFFKVVNDVKDIYERIKDSKYSRLINHTSRVSLPWTIYSNLIIPIFYITKKFNMKLLLLMTKWYFRHLNISGVSLNIKTVNIEFIEILKKIIDNDKHDYYSDVLNILKNIKKQNLDKTKFMDVISNTNFNNTNSLYLLLFYETCLSNDLVIVPFKYTLEHIVSQNDGIILKIDNINKLGNLTLLEGPNSDNGHKGNFSLKDKKYSFKSKQYKKSSSIITQNISNIYDEFDEETIIQRTKKLSKQIEKQTKIE